MSKWVGLGERASEETASKGINFPLIIEYVSNGHAVVFPSLKLESFKDDLSINWQRESVFGRMDDITTYENTKRKISMTFKLGEGTLEEAILHHKRIRKLMDFQYPVYHKRANAMTLAKPPLLNVKYSNLISTRNRDTGEATGRPLICVLDSLSYDPILNSKVDHLPYVNETDIYAKGYRVSLTFTVLHDEELGFQESPPAFSINRAHDSSIPSNEDDANNPELGIVGLVDELE
jgi:hypothetical protein